MLTTTEIKPMISEATQNIGKIHAEKVGFEPTMPLRAYRFSRPAPSTTRTPLRKILSLITQNYADFRNTHLRKSAISAGNSFFLSKNNPDRCKDNNLFSF